MSGKETAEETTTEDTTTTEDEAGKTTESEEEGGDKAATEGAEDESSAEGEEQEDETSTETDANEETVDEVVVTIGDQAPPQDDDNKAPEWVRELRKTNRELARQNRELQKQVAEKSTATETVEVGPKPKLSDFDYDSDKFEEALDKWKAKKQAADNASAQRQAAEKKQQEQWQEKLEGYGKQKTELKVKDFAEAEAEVIGSLNQTQQGIVVSGADNAALVFYALGRNPAKLKELSSITDPVKFAFAVAKLEKDLKVTTRKAPPPPEKTVTGSAPRKGSDTTLERLRAEAEKTGDYSKVVAHKRQTRKAS